MLSAGGSEPELRGERSYGEEETCSSSGSTAGPELVGGRLSSDIFEEKEAGPRGPLQALTRLVCFPCGIFHFLRGLQREFGGYVWMVSLQYGCNQGMGMAFSAMAYKMLFLQEPSEGGLGVGGAESARLRTAATIPWSVKPVIGMLSDALPLFGYRRTSYLVLAAVCGVAAFGGLGLLPLGPRQAVPFLFLMNLSVAGPDVVIDAVTCELSSKAESRASDLQSISWGSLAVGGVIAAPLVGLLAEQLPPRVLFTICLVFPCSILLPGCLGCLQDERVPSRDRRCDVRWFRENPALGLCAACLSVVACGLSVLQLFVTNFRVRGAVTVFAGLLLITGAFATLRRISSMLAKVAVFIFLREALQPSVSDALFQWSRKHPEGPQFSTSFLGLADMFGYLGLFLGIVIYRNFMTGISFRKIFAFAQVCLVISNLGDYVMVSRWHLSLGIPDHIFLLGDEAFAECMRRFFSMPMLVLAAKVCPKDAEATLFAMLMALSNSGWSMGQFLGSLLLESFGVVDCYADVALEAPHAVSETAYVEPGCGNLARVVLIKSLCRCLPLVLIPFLVPNGTPDGPADEDPSGTSDDEDPDARETSSGSENEAE